MVTRGSVSFRGDLGSGLCFCNLGARPLICRAELHRRDCVLCFLYPQLPFILYHQIGEDWAGKTLSLVWKR